jgi:hypothetical protein
MNAQFYSDFFFVGELFTSNNCWINCWISETLDAMGKFQGDRAKVPTAARGRGISLSPLSLKAANNVLSAATTQLIRPENQTRDGDPKEGAFENESLRHVDGCKGAAVFPISMAASPRSKLWNSTECGLISSTSEPSNTRQRGSSPRLEFDISSTTQSVLRSGSIMEVGGFFAIFLFL